MGVACCACTSSSAGASAHVDVSHHNDELLRHPRQVGGGHRSLSLSSSRRNDSQRSDTHREMHSTIAVWPATRLAPGVAVEFEEHQRQQQQGQAQQLVPTHELSQQAISARLHRSTYSDSRFDSVSQTETELPFTDIRQRRIHGRAAKCDETIEPPEETPTFPGDMAVDYDYSAETILEVRSGTIAPLESRADSFATAIDAAGAVYREGAAEGSSGAFRKITSRASSGGWARSTASDLAALMLAGTFGVSPEADAFGGDGLQQQAPAVVMEQPPRARSSSACPSPSSCTSPRQRSSRATTTHSSSSGEGRQPFLAIAVPPTTVVVAPPSKPPRPSIPCVRCGPVCDSNSMTPDGGDKQNMLVFSMMPHSPTQGNFQSRDENMIARGHRDRSDAQAHIAAVRPLASDSEDELLVSAIASTAGLAPQIVRPLSPFSPVKYYAMNVSGYQQRRDGTDGDGDGRSEDPTSPVFRTSTGSSITAAPSLPTRNPLALHIKSTPISIVHGAQSCISSVGSHEHDMAPASPSIVAATLAAGPDAPQPPSHASHFPKLLLVPSLFPARISSSTATARHHVSGGGDFQGNNNNADLGTSWEHGSLSLNPFQVPNTTTMAHLHDTDTCGAATPTSQSCNLVHILAAS